MEFTCGWTWNRNVLNFSVKEATEMLTLMRTVVKWIVMTSVFFIVNAF